MSNKVHHVLLTIASALVLVTGAAAQPVIPLGEDFQVNNSTTSYQTAAALAVDSSGEFVVVWVDYSGQDGDGTGVFSRRFDSAGQAFDTEVLVNSYTTGGQRLPAVAVEGGGDFVVAWMGSSATDDLGVSGQRFDSAGVRLGASFEINTFTTGLQGYPSADAADGGGFVVVWESSGQDGSASGIFLRRFDSAGAPTGGEVQVNTTTISNQRDSEVATLAGGDFVVVWTDYGGADGNGQGVFGQRLDSAGQFLGGEFQVNTTILGYQRFPEVAAVGDGFVVAWADEYIDGSLGGIVAQRFDAAGTTVGDEIQVNTTTTLAQTIPSVAGFDGGDFVVAWRSPFQDGDSTGIFGQLFDTSGNFMGGEFQVNSYTTDAQSSPALAVGRHGEFVATWISEEQDGDRSGVFGRRFAVPIFADGFESGDTSAWSLGIRPGRTGGH